MEEKLIEFETAKLLHKVGGFSKQWGDVAYKDEDGKLYGDRGMYTDFPAPTQSLLQKWLRDSKGIYVLVDWDVVCERGFICNILMVDEVRIYPVNHSLLDKHFEEYEEAYEAGLKEALTLIK